MLMWFAGPIATSRLPVSLHFVITTRFRCVDLFGPRRIVGWCGTRAYLTSRLRLFFLLTLTIRHVFKCLYFVV